MKAEFEEEKEGEDIRNDMHLGLRKEERMLVFVISVPN